MLIVQGLNVPCMAAPQKIRIVPNKAKKAVVTPKKPTKKGPTQKSNRSPPISVPPRTRYFFSKLSKAMRLSPRVWRPVSDDRSAVSQLFLGSLRARRSCAARSMIVFCRHGMGIGLVSEAHVHCGGLEPVHAGRQNHQVDHRCQQEEEDALSHENAAGVEDEPYFIELSHISAPPQNQGAQMYVAR